MMPIPDTSTNASIVIWGLIIVASMLGTLFLVMLKKIISMFEQKMTSIATDLKNYIDKSDAKTEKLAERLTAAEIEIRAHGQRMDDCRTCP